MSSLLLIVTAGVALLPARMPHDTIPILEFERVPWGADRSAVERSHGPVSTSGLSTQEWGVRLIYLEPKFGGIGFISFNVHRTRGLISGNYTYPFGSEPVCEDLFAGFRDVMAGQYGPPAEERTTQGALRYCQGAARGDTGARASWSDRDGRRITIRIQGASVVVDVESGS
jgi:hypothetical protein